MSIAAPHSGVSAGIAPACTSISRAHLAAAAMGQGGAAVHDLLDDLLRGASAGLDRRLDAVDRIA